MTERGDAALRRSQSYLTIGPSGLSWDGTALTFKIDEVSVPLPSRIRGRVRVYPAALTQWMFFLDRERRHRWWPVSPCAEIEVDLQRPRLHWRGKAYLDSNAGDAPLENAFRHWHWSRAALPGAAAVLYDVTDRDGEDLSIALRFDRLGRFEFFSPPGAVDLPRTLWQIRRSSRSDPNCSAVVLKTLEDTPFYARSVITSGLLGEPATSVHESLSLDRFRKTWVRTLLPFRMPRVKL